MRWPRSSPLPPRCTRPQLLSRPPYEEMDKLDNSTDALHAFGRVLDEARPDAVLVIGIDHLETFWLEAVPTFTLVISEECEAACCAGAAQEDPHLARGGPAQGRHRPGLRPEPTLRRPSWGTRSSPRSSTSSATATSRSYRC